MTLDERIEQLMQPGCDYDPIRTDNLAEALANFTSDQIDVLAIGLRAANILDIGLLYQPIGITIDEYVREHWKKLATTQAQADIDREKDEACSKCGGNEGKGCPACDAKLRREARE